MHRCDAPLPSCQRSFPMLFSMRQHTNDSHGYNPFIDPQCSICRKVLKSGIGCLMHTWDVHENPTGPQRHQVLGQIVGYPRFAMAMQEYQFQKPTKKGLFESFQDPEFDLNIYVDDELIAKEEFLINIRAAVDALVRFIHQEKALNVDRIIKGGSVGKGTALHEKSDIDLVMFSNDFHSMEYFHRKLESNLEELEACINKFNTYDREGHRLVVEGKSPLAVQLKMKPNGCDDYFDVDLLPAFDNLKYNNGAQGTFRKIGRESDTKKRKNYSSSLTELQIEFVRKQPTPVKRLIVLAKHWMKSVKSPLMRNLPNSYLTELITIHTWEKAEEPISFDIKQGFKSVLKTLKNYCNLYVSWASIVGIPMPTFTSRPVVVDPANPYNNVCEGVKDWDLLAEEAQRYMDSPLLVHITPWRNIGHQ